MIFGKKLQTKIDNVTRVISDFSSQLAAMKDGNEKLAAQVEQMSRNIQKHDVDLEDALDLISEIREQESEAQEKLLQELAAVRKDDRMQQEAEAEKLLRLIGCYHEQFRHLSLLLSDQPQWSRQIALIEEKLREDQELAGVRILGKAGEKVDYDLHEVIDVRTTENPDLDKCIAEVYEAGYIQNSRIKRARVAAYRYAAVERAVL